MIDYDKDIIETIILYYFDSFKEFQSHNSVEFEKNNKSLRNK